MEAVHYAARGNLRRLLQLHPTWTRAQLAQATGMSLGWVSKWKKRLASAPPDDEPVLHGLSRAQRFLYANADCDLIYLLFYHYSDTAFTFCVSRR